MNTNTTIEINGKRYDANSGQPLQAAKPKPAQRSIDGVVRKTHVKSAVVTPRPSKPAAVVAAPALKPVPAKAQKVHNPASHHASHTPKPSHTLMRQAVKKPAHSQLAKLKIQPRTDVLVKQPSITVEPKASVTGINPKRSSRARTVPQSKLISRFGDSSEAQPIILAPAQVYAIPAAPVAPALAEVPRTAHTVKPAPGSQRSLDIFEQALKHATSHEQPAPASKRAHATNRRSHRAASRIMSVSSAALAVVLVGGFLAYQNMANVTVRLASNRAGFAASLPGYRPSGFSVGKFAYSAGNVTINFHSNSDQRKFAIVEQRSDWDSDALLNEFVATRSSDYQTVQTAGRTVYLFGDNNATWVNAGVWYQVTSQGALSSSQLVNLASTM